METEKFNYVIARKWYADSNQLNCYTYFNTVFYGDMGDAIATRDFIRGRADSNNDEFEIHRIEDNFLKVD